MSSEEKDTLKVRFNGKTINLLISNKQLSLKTLQQHFPLATGLKYLYINEETCVSYIKDTDVMEIIDLDSIHDVYVPQGSAKSTMKQSRKRNLIIMLEEVDKIKGCSLSVQSTGNSGISEIASIMDSDNSQQLKSSNREVTKSKKLADYVEQENKKVRVIRVNWKHRTSIVNPYKPRFSIKSQIKIELDYNKDYSYEEVKKIIVDAFLTPDVARYFENSEINLGLQNNVTLYSFKTEDGKECGFWEFCRKFRDSGNRLTINLLTTDYYEKIVSPKSTGKRRELSKQKMKVLNPVSPLKELQNLQNDLEKNSEVQVSVTTTSHSSENVELEQSTTIQEIINLPNYVDKESEKQSEILLITVKKQSVETQKDISETVFVKPVAPVKKKAISYDAETNISNLSLNIPIIEKDELLLEGRIGEGAQGVVRLGKWCGTPVAVNILLRNRNEVNALREIKISEVIRHSNLILLMGICVSNYDYYMVMEYFDGANLFDVVITKKSNIVLTMDNKHKIASDVIAAFNFFHQQKNAVIHRDVKSNNILINKYMQVKLCDLGLSKQNNTETYLQTSVDGRFKGTLLFLAPEIFIGREKPTVACDVWATGCTLIELYGEESVWNLDLSCDIYFELYTKIMKKCIPQVEVIPSVLKEEIKKCFMYDASDRIKMSELDSFYKVEFSP